MTSNIATIPRKTAVAKQPPHEAAQTTPLDKVRELIGPWTETKLYGLTRSSALTIPTVALEECNVTGSISPETAAALAAQASAPAQLIAIYQKLLAAQTAEPDDASTAIIVAQMFDAYPNARLRDPISTFRAYAMDIAADRHGPAMVARACQIARKKSEFPPTVAEILRACDLAQAEAGLAIRWIEHRLRCRIVAERALTGRMDAMPDFGGPAEAPLVIWRGPPDSLEDREDMMGIAGRSSCAPGRRGQTRLEKHYQVTGPSTFQASSNPYEAHRLGENDYDA